MLKLGIEGVRSRQIGFNAITKRIQIICHMSKGPSFNMLSITKQFPYNYSTLKRFQVPSRSTERNPRDCEAILVGVG